MCFQTYTFITGNYSRSLLGSDRRRFLRWNKWFIITIINHRYDSFPSTLSEPTLLLGPKSRWLGVYRWKTRLALLWWALTWDEVATGTGFGCDPPGPKNIRKSLPLASFVVFATFFEGAMEEDDEDPNTRAANVTSKRGCHIQLRRYGTRSCDNLAGKSPDFKFCYPSAPHFKVRLWVTLRISNINTISMKPMWIRQPKKVSVKRTKKHQQQIFERKYRSSRKATEDQRNIPFKKKG